MNREIFDERLAALREARARLPELFRNRHASRRRRAVAGHSGRLLLVEADEPARGQLFGAAGAEALADREHLLYVLACALGTRGVDGIVATADLVDDLLILEQLDERLTFGVVNARGPLGTTSSAGNGLIGYDVETLANGHLDGAMACLRIDVDDPATTAAMEGVARITTTLAANGLVTLVEPQWVRSAEEDRSAEALRRAIGITTALGGRSPYLWLVLPASAPLAEVVTATTVPVLMRIDEDPTDLDEAEERWRQALRVTGVRGLIVPAARLFPARGEPLDVIDAAVRALRTVVEEVLAPGR